MRKYAPVLGAVALSVCLLLGGMAVGMQITQRGAQPLQEPPQEARTENSTQEYAVSAVGSIAIPGYDTMTFQTGERVQHVHLENPAQNTCHFIVSIILPDETTLYKSGLIAPGTTVEKLRLLTAPEAGTYENTVLRYSCWNVSPAGELSEVSGADTFFTLEVIP